MSSLEQPWYLVGPQVEDDEEDLEDEDQEDSFADEDDEDAYFDDEDQEDDEE